MGGSECVMEKSGQRRERHEESKQRKIVGGVECEDRSKENHNLVGVSLSSQDE